MSNSNAKFCGAWFNVVLALLLAAFCAALGTKTTASNTLPKPRAEVAVTVAPKYSTEAATRTYTYTESIGDVTNTSSVQVSEVKRGNEFVRQFGDPKNHFEFVEQRDGAIHFDFGTTLVPTTPLYPIRAGEQRNYHLQDGGTAVTLIAEANETLMVGKEMYSTLRLHTQIPMQDGNILDVYLWLTADGKLIRYIRSMDNSFELTWALQEGPKQDVGLASN